MLVADSDPFDHALAHGGYRDTIAAPCRYVRVASQVTHITHSHTVIRVIKIHCSRQERKNNYMLCQFNRKIVTVLGPGGLG